MAGNTVRLHRVLRARRPSAFTALFSTRMRSSNGCRRMASRPRCINSMRRVGGSYAMSFTNFSNGQRHSFGGEYLELVPPTRLRHTDRFDDANLPGQMQTTIELRAVFCGTELSVVQEGIPEMIPPEACYLGWQESLVLLAQLVEAEIPAE